MQKVGFDVHPEIIRQFIWKQHGGVSKSIIELIQNSIDAKATKIDVTITSRGFIVEDNGHGFKSEEEVMRYFRVFGQPQESDKEFGTFRVGRGQILALAHTQWQSNSYKMDVNLNSDDSELCFLYSKLESPVNGCMVSGTWFKPITVREVLNAVMVECAYLKVNLTLNTQPILKRFDSSVIYSDDELDVLHVKSDSGIRYYNKGIFVCHDYSETGYHVVSKSKQFELNTARNFIIANDKLKSKALHFIQKHKSENHKKTKEHRWTVPERKEALEYLLRNHEDMDIEDVVEYLYMPIIREAEGEYTSLYGLYLSQVIVVRNNYEKSYIPSFLASKGLKRPSEIKWVNYIADEDTCVFMDSEWIESISLSRHNGERFFNGQRLSYSSSSSEYLFSELGILLSRVSNAIINTKDQIEGFFDWGLNALKGMHSMQNVALQFKPLIKSLEGDENRVQDASLEENELDVLNIIRKTNKQVFQNPRDIFVGTSNRAEAWTDGESHITLNYELIEKLANQTFSAGNTAETHLALLLIHEYGHKEASIETLDHSFEFYKQFHDATFSQTKGPMYARDEINLIAAFVHVMRAKTSYHHRKKTQEKIDNKSYSLEELKRPSFTHRGLFRDDFKYKLKAFEYLDEPMVVHLKHLEHLHELEEKITISKKFREAFIEGSGIIHEMVKEHEQRILKKFTAIVESLHDKPLKTPVYYLEDVSKFGKGYDQFKIKLSKELKSYVSVHAFARALDANNPVDRAILEYLDIANVKWFSKGSYSGVRAVPMKEVKHAWPSFQMSLFLQPRERNLEA